MAGKMTPEVRQAATQLWAAMDADPSIGEAFRAGFAGQIQVRRKVRFKPSQTAAERMSAEEAGLRAALRQMLAPTTERSQPNG